MVVDDITFWREFVSTILRREQSFAVVSEVSEAKTIQMAKQLPPTIVMLEKLQRAGNRPGNPRDRAERQANLSELRS